MSQASCKTRYGLRYLLGTTLGPIGPERRAYAIKRILPSTNVREEIGELPQWTLSIAQSRDALVRQLPHNYTFS
jgi:hypothetical protein